SVGVVALLLGSYAAAFCLDFELGSGVAVPTQLILVPMLFVVPVGWVPLMVAGGILLGNTASWALGNVHLERVPLPVVTSWHAVAFAAQSSPYGVVLALPLVALLSGFARERRVRIDHELELRDAYRGTAFLLGDVVEADDSYTGAHSRAVVELALSVGDELGLGGRERRDLEFAALLHDVGKVRVPNSIINKPGPLSADERAVMERHTVEGERLLLRVGGLLGEIGRVVRSCHERWDGQGYPDGLAG